MGKHGPCHHCGVTSTPLWRNGPPEKPILCNACGSRWRTKGSLTNYTPMHARELIDPEVVRVSKVKGFTFNPKERKSPKKKQSNGAVEFEREMQMPYSDQNFRKILEEDTSNRSSSGSAISYSESCAYFGYTDASDLTGSAQSNVWESLVPSKKRTCVARPRPSPLEKLTKDLCSILHEQRSSYLSGSSEEDLLYESETPVGSVEIGHGGVLIRNPNSKTVEEESEASSLPVDNKSYIVNERYSGSASVSVHSESKGPSSLYVSTEKYRKPMSQVEQDYVKRDKVSHDKFGILQNRGSPLGSMDLTDVVNFEKFMDLLTHEEQKRLMKFLPSVDYAKHSESLKSMFNSPQFRESLSYFQQLLLEGIFDLSFPGTNIEECRTLKKIVLLNLMKSRWVEPYNQLKVVKCKQITVGKGVSTGLNSHEISKMISLKRPRDSQHQSFSDVKGSMRSPKRVSKSCGMNPPSSYIPRLDSSNKGSKSNQCTDDSADNEGACFSPRSLFALPPDRSSILVSLQFTDDSADQDLLLDAPCNAPLPEAELLYHPWKQKMVPISSTAENGVLDGEESLSNFPSSSSTSK